jgi:hypothetical protein
MFLATRIPHLTAQMRAATLRAADEQPDAVPDRRLIERLERRGYRVIPPQRAA